MSNLRYEIWVPSTEHVPDDADLDRVPVGEPGPALKPSFEVVAVVDACPS